MFLKKFMATVSVCMIAMLALPTYAYSPFSTRELDELEKLFVEEINQAPNVIRNPLAKQYINQIGNRLAKFSHQPKPDFFIVDSKEINAFAGPGGHIGINSQLILASDNESELAAVMAHEMAHVRLHHLYRMLQHQKQMRIPMIASLLASAALGILNPVLGSGAMMASLSGVAQDSINYTRSNEKEADRVGINMLIAAGYDPRGMAAFFKKMQQSSRYYYTDNIPAILRTHPMDDDRIAEAQNRINQLPQKSYRKSPDYAYFKELIRNIVGDSSKALVDYYKAKCQGQADADACKYGQALTQTSLNHYKRAIQLLTDTSTNNTENPYIQVALANAYIGLKQNERAEQILKQLYQSSPDNYGVIVSYAQGLLNMGKPSDSAALLLKASRTYKDDLSVCMLLSQAENQASRKDYAYFTLAQCELLQGRFRSAMQQLKTAKKLAKNNEYLQARIQAKMEEIKYWAKT